MTLFKKKLITGDFQITKVLVIYFVFFCELFISSSIKVYGQNRLRKDSVVFYELGNSRLELGADYLIPTRFSNKINTISLNGFYWKKRFTRANVFISVGLSANYAWGYSTQWYPLGDTAYLAVDYKNSAFGVGPVFQIAPTVVRVNRFSIITEANGGILFYNKKFPYGGDVYNFLFRAGPSIAYRLNNNYSLKIGYRWMHVSNAKGYGNQNPFYEAQGIILGFFLVK